MNRIDKRFKELIRRNKKAFIAFVTAGYPSLDMTRKFIFEFSRIGVDIIELGVPFSDPMADGPVIQEASQVALKNKVHLADILNLVKAVRKASEIPICLMTYYNPILCFGEERFLKVAGDYGVDGVIVPDLPPEEGRAFIRSAHKYGIDIICFVAPTTSLERIKYIANIAKGFIYYVSLTGVTGPRQKLPADLRAKLKLINKLTTKPVCVGFGVSSPFQVKEILRHAAGVIVGSAIVKKIKENIGKKDLLEQVSKFVLRLKG